MRRDQIGARNRANALKSTGPITEQGKAIVAGNARRHGATAQPDPGSVAAWLALILDRPDILPADLLPDDEAGYRALALAQAETRLVAAEQASRQFEGRNAQPTGVAKELREFTDLVWTDGLLEDKSREDILAVQSALEGLRQSEEDAIPVSVERRRLLTRYLREARAQRRKAFKAWAAMRTGGTVRRELKLRVSRNKASFLA